MPYTNLKNNYLGIIFLNSNKDFLFFKQKQLSQKAEALIMAYIKKQANKNNIKKPYSTEQLCV